LQTIGLFALVGYPYTFKFLWAPLMVRYVPPFLGQRRGWMLLCQLALMLSLFGLGQSHPAENMKVVAILAVCIAFFGASQDIVLDAYRGELLSREELGTGTGVFITAYRLAMIVSGSLALILADHMSWGSVYTFMAGLMLIGVFASFCAPEPRIETAHPKSLREAVLDPIREYFQRRGAIEILVFVVLYKLGDVLALALQTRFLLGLGFSKSDIGYISKGFGLAMTILGSFIGGALMDRLGMKRALLSFGFFQALSILSFSVLAVVGQSYPVMAGALAFENLCSGLGNAAFIAYLTSLCSKRFTATQYALLTSLGAIAPVIFASRTGYLVEQMGWANFYVFCTLAAIPGLLMLWFRYDNWEQQSSVV
jgi:PAT family beta-lactamase induction signal transducer AmpG